MWQRWRIFGKDEEKVKKVKNPLSLPQNPSSSPQNPLSPQQNDWTDITDNTECVNTNWQRWPSRESGTENKNSFRCLSFCHWCFLLSPPISLGVKEPLHYTIELFNGLTTYGNKEHINFTILNCEKASRFWSLICSVKSSLKLVMISDLWRLLAIPVADPVFCEHQRLALLAFVSVTEIWCMHRNVMTSGEMKHEMTLFHTMGPNKNVFFQTHLLFVTIYVLVWSSSVKLST